MPDDFIVNAKTIEDLLAILRDMGEFYGWLVSRMDTEASAKFNPIINQFTGRIMAILEGKQPELTVHDALGRLQGRIDAELAMCQSDDERLHVLAEAGNAWKRVEVIVREHFAKAKILN